MAGSSDRQFGQLAAEAGQRLPLRILASRAGFYIGTLNTDDEPYTRESVQYWPTERKAVTAFLTGVWTQRSNL